MGVEKLRLPELLLAELDSLLIEEGWFNPRLV
jgi:hypothetical protein